jgi:hypothetical protein
MGAPPGLEPGLVRGKSPVPYPSGVTRVVGIGRESNPLCRSTAVLRTAAPHGATDPWSPEPVVAPVPAKTFPMRLSRCCCPNWMPGALAGPEGVEPSAAGFGDRGATVARALANGECNWPRMTECADLGSGLEAETEGSATSSCRDCRTQPRGAECPRKTQSAHAGLLSMSDRPDRHAGAPSTAWALPHCVCSVKSLRAIGGR